MLETELEAPKNNGSSESHERVQRKSSAIMQRVYGAKIEDKTLVENIFDDESQARTGQYRKRNCQFAVEDVHNEVLRADICHCRNKCENCIDNRQLHRI